MKRRKFILGTGAVAAGGASLLGSGALGSVEAERRVEIQMADDSEAFLALKQLGSGKYTIGGRSIEDGTPEVVQFSFPGVGERLNNPELGLGKESVYEFARDSGESQKTNPIEGLLRITNQGTQAVEVHSEHETDSDLEIGLYDVTDSDSKSLRDEPAVLNVGEKVDVGFRIRTFGVELGTYDETLTIVADNPGS